MWQSARVSVCTVSDVDCAWLALPHALLASLPEADVLAGTDCLHVPDDADRSARTRVTPRCGHHPGSQWAAWFNTGVLVFRATEHALSFAERWRDRMAVVVGDGSWGNQVDDQAGHHGANTRPGLGECQCHCAALIGLRFAPV